MEWERSGVGPAWATTNSKNRDRPAGDRLTRSKLARPFKVPFRVARSRCPRLTFSFPSPVLAHHMFPERSFRGETVVRRAQQP
jgi:hypothetical protein